MKTKKRFIQIRFYWYSLLTNIFDSKHFSKYKLKYGAMLLTLAVAGSCNNENSNPKDSTSVSDSIREQHKPAVPAERHPEAPDPAFCYDPVREPENITDVANKIYKATEVQPQFPGGDAELINYLSENLKYPKDAVEQGIEGRVVVQFVVNKTGKISDVKVLLSVHPSCDKEAIRLMKSMPKWIPGKQAGEPVNVYYTIPIRFRLPQ